MPTPPWLNDSHPQWWHPLSIAAKYYFKKSPETIRRLAINGDLAAAGVPVYFDGTRWYIRVQLEAAQIPKTAYTRHT